MRPFITDVLSRLESSQRRIRSANDGALSQTAERLARTNELLSECVARGIESERRILERPTPPTPLDCPDCGANGAMKLHNVVSMQPRNVPLRYVCSSCGSTLTIPPRIGPLSTE